MALDTNVYNSVFKIFVDFAQHRSGAGLNDAVANAKVNSSRKYEVGSASKTSGSWMSRTDADKVANDNTREIFRDAVARMFGGASKIPPSVKEAMRLDDYGQGRPLTARRILLVKQAIDARAELCQFQSEDLKVEAQNLGFTKAELPRLALATHFYAQATGKDEMAAMREVATYGTKANRLAFYGGRFLENPETFKAGMELLDSFRDWYADLNRFVCDNNNKGKHFADAKTVTQMNVVYRVASNSHGQPGLEAMIFQDIASDPNFNLKKRGEDAFGFKNNAAMRYFGRNGQNSIFGTIFNAPPEKRRILFAASDALTPLISDIQTAALFENNRKGKVILGNGVFAARVLNHLGELEAIISRNGKLTAKDVFTTCFPDIDAKAMLQAMIDARVAQIDKVIAKLKGKGGDPQKIRQHESMREADLALANAAKEDNLYSLATLNYWYDDHIGVKIKDELEKIGLAADEIGGALVSVKEMMVSSGCTVDEAIDAYRNGKTLPLGNCQTGYSMELDEYPNKGFEQMKLDLTRGTNYSRRGTEENYLAPGEQTFKFTFPDGPTFTCGNAEGAEIVEEKVKQLCGEGHTLQAQIVGASLSQAAAVPIKGSLVNFGIKNDEHAVLNYSLSKNDRTGAITIRYSSPESLPTVSFSWTCTVNPDGTSSSTPLEISRKAM